MSRRRGLLTGALALLLAVPIVHAGPVVAQVADPAPPKERVELPELRTESSEVYAEPSGLRTLVAHPAPVRVRRGKGWVPVDTTLRMQADGTVRPEATVTELVFSGGGDRALVALGTSRRQLRMSWPAELPRPVLDGATATYPEVFPGVDLKLRAEADGFAQVLVVKTRAAAQRLERVDFGIATTGLRVGTRPDGSTVALDSTGAAVFAADKAVMWDSTGAPEAVRHSGSQDSRQVTIPTTRTAGGLSVVPDRALLTSPATRFPVYVDPSWSAGHQLWTHVNQMAPGQSYWNFDRAEGAKVGLSWDLAVRYRSYFQFRTEALAGSTVVSAAFDIVLNHSPSGSPTPAMLWHTKAIDASQPLTWNNSVPGHWIRELAEASGNAWTNGGQPDMAMRFTSDKVKTVMQGVADARAGTATFGLRAKDEGNKYQWKKFHPNTAALVVSYNNAPRSPVKVNFSRPRPCGTASEPTLVSGLTPPTFAAVASDPDNDNLTTRLSIHRADTGAVAYQSLSSTTTSGAAFAWPQLPPTALAAGVAYYYVASSNDNVANDGIEFGPESARCYFILDATRPSVPQLASTDFPPEGEPGIPARTTGVVTLRPGGSDTDVAEYLYGFQQDKVLSRIKARPDGTAQLPVTVWPDPVTGPQGRLFVRAVDRAGNASTVSPAYDLIASDNPQPIPRVRGDINGDGRADISAVLDHGWGRTGVWNVLSKPGGLQTGTFAWDSGENGGFALYRTRPVQGDFDGDQRADLVLFREEAGRRIAAYLLKSDGNRYDTPSQPVWHSGSAGWPLSGARIFAGDVDGDAKDDIAVQLDNGNGSWRVLVFRGGNLGTPVQWVSTAAGSGEWYRSAPLLADVDADGKDDLVDMTNLGACRTRVTVRKSAGTSFATTPVTFYEGPYCWEKSKPVVADVNGDNRDDLVAMYEHGQTDLGLRVFTSSGTAMAESEWFRGALDPAKAALSAGDYTGDRKDDVALVYALDGGGRDVSTLTSSGTSFAAPSTGWREESVGATTGPRFDIDNRAYELVARHSSKCLDVPGASQADAAPIHQYTCNGNIQQRFRLAQIAGTEQFEVHTVHGNGANGDGKARCLDVDDRLLGDDVPLLQWPCVGTGNQQLTVEYLEGSSYDTVVRLRFAHSGKCAAVRGGSLGDAVPVVQQTCTADASQQWILRPAFTGQTLSGRYKVASVRGGHVLDIKDCGTNPASTDIRTWQWVAGSPCQRWQIVPKGDDVYQIHDPNSQKNVDVEGCPGSNGSPVLPITPNDSADCQSWRIEPAAGGSWSILQNKSGRSMDVAGCSALAGADVITWPYWNGTCQRWTLTPAN
ncbi:RICIN domain-containing protein [Kribbella sp. CA-247076]|uniref:RICIN domain-containing protein n=1 Tax=Kribbella sp. CA-247076 TaxID=3239941 RepID=UPI003D90CA13